ncbi:hypothetical protein FFWV33_02315 [Flavobacterium faecale]|uniref:Helix-turn-helix domain-containing protein n=1 Tax=Flavobacterium faecale TaxID=1355330 RepID=A0A2S1L9Q1_9FLAO|nr:helix-turn-helix domain-containing protein [Flavobacterium faecale]AWG20444.1 hypothetical protein FFWV33_02315 [Flavobacterium faecale]
MIENIRLIDLTKSDLISLIQQTVATEFQRFSNLMKTVPKEEEQTKIITRDEAAKLLNVSHTTLWKWSKDKILVARKINSRVYYLKNDVLDKLNAVA